MPVLCSAPHSKSTQGLGHAGWSCRWAQGSSCAQDACWRGLAGSRTEFDLVFDLESAGDRHCCGGRACLRIRQGTTAHSESSWEAKTHCICATHSGTDGKPWVSHTHLDGFRSMSEGTVPSRQRVSSTQRQAVAASLQVFGTRTTTHGRAVDTAKLLR